MTNLPRQTRLGDVTGQVSQRLAGRLSRRSFFSHAGKLAVATAVGSSLVNMFPEHASAAAGLTDGTILDPILELDEMLSGCSDEPCSGPVTCNHTDQGVNCCGRKTATCGSIGSPGQCPSGSCICGSWTTCSKSCASQIKTLHDCCGGCNSGLKCQCVDGSDGNLHPTCCRSKCYAGGCGSYSTSFIKCRYSKCGSS